MAQAPQARRQKRRRTAEQQAARERKVAWKTPERLDFVIARVLHRKARPDRLRQVDLAPLWTSEGVSRYRLDLLVDATPAGDLIPRARFASSHFVVIRDEGLVLLRCDPPLPDAPAPAPTSTPTPADGPDQDPAIST
jgi:hypothetical protein